MLYRRVVFTSAVFALTCAVCAAFPAPPESPKTPPVPPAPPTRPVWKSGPAFVARLAPEVAVAGYRLRLPKGYAMQTMPGPGGMTGYAWTGAPRPEDGTRAYLMLLPMRPPAGETTRYTPAQILTKMLAGIARSRRDWRVSVIQEGTVNGQPFVRAYWTGTDAATGAAMRGFGYAAVDGDGFVYLSSQDVVPHDKLALPLAEAAALTLAFPPPAPQPATP